MKKILVTIAVTAMLLTASAAFAGDGLWIGPSVLYDPILTFNELTDPNSDIQFDSDDMLYGAEGRLDIGMFQGSVNSYYFPEAELFYTLANIGIYADLGIIGLGLTAGPVLATDLNAESEETDELWTNMKVEADFILDELLFSAFFTAYAEDYADFLDSDKEFGDFYGNFGISVLFQL